MKKTGALKVSLSTAIDSAHLVMHPNEGFELGLMRVDHPVKLCYSQKLEDFLKGQPGESEEVHIQLLNECPKETVLFGIVMHKLIGQPVRAVLLFDGDRLFVHPQ